MWISVVKLEASKPKGMQAPTLLMQVTSFIGSDKEAVIQSALTLRQTYQQSNKSATYGVYIGRLTGEITVPTVYEEVPLPSE